MPRRGLLRRQLLALQPADEAEGRHRERMLDLIGSAGDPFSRSRFDPGHFTASAFVLNPARDALLLILHGKLHRWLQPGGHVDPGDVDLLAAAQREVLEETGVIVRSKSFSFSASTASGSRPRNRRLRLRERERRTRTNNLLVEAQITPAIFDLDIHPIPPNAPKGEPAHEHFDVRFLFTADREDFTAASDAKDARWVRLDEVTREMTDDSVMRVVRKLRGLVGP